MALLQMMLPKIEVGLIKIMPLLKWHYFGLTI